MVMENPALVLPAFPPGVERPRGRAAQALPSRLAPSFLITDKGRCWKRMMAAT